MKMTDDMMKQMHISKQGQEEFMGKTCDVYVMDNPQMGKGKFLVWKNIMMRSDATTMGMNIVTEVTSLKENENIDASQFEIPGDVQFAEAGKF